MKEYPPYKVFISFIWVLIALFLFRILISNSTIELGGHEIRLPRLSVDRTVIVRGSGPVIAAPIYKPADEPAESQLKYEISDLKASHGKLVHPQPVEYPDETQMALLGFFESLQKSKLEGKKTRILYYGDSQIEGDRIVQYLRQSFQKEFGGSGSGLYALYEPLYTSLIFELSNSKNWKKYGVVRSGNGPGENRFGAALSYCIFSGIKAFSSFNLRTSNDQFNQISDGRLYIESPISHTEVGLSSMLDNFTATVPSRPGIQAIPFAFEQSAEQFKISINSTGSPIIHGISFESDDGVIVDHIPLRGSAGLEFSSINPEVYKQQLSYLDPQLIILHFGINVVPAKRSEFDYYRQLLVREIKTIRSMAGDIPILLIGVSDMGKIRGSHARSFASVPKVSAAMRDAARETGSAFFDLFQFMGGMESCILWEKAHPPLLRKDYTHFTIPGGAVVADGIYAALIEGFQRYVEQGENGE